MDYKSKKIVVQGILTVLILLLYIQSVQAQEVNYSALYGLGDTRYHKLQSELIEQDYHLFVMLPKGYVQDKKYPVVYLLDGGAMYPILAAYYRYLRVGKELPELIIAGISYGTSDWQKGNQRARDYTAPSQERSYWGGAAKFVEILNKEIFPLIENKYSVDNEKRIVFGQSLGGQFALYAALKSPDLFYGYIASNPALHRNLDFFLTTETAKLEKKVLPKLFVSSGSDDEKRFRIPAIKWMQHWREKDNLPWQLKTTTLEGQNHFSAVPQAFRQGLKWIFKEKQ